MKAAKITGARIWSAEAEANVLSHVRHDFSLRHRPKYAFTQKAGRELRRDCRERIARVRDYRRRIADGKAKP